MRVELQPSSVLITLTANRNLDRNLQSARSDPPQHFSEADDAVAAVAEFLKTFLDGKVGETVR